MPTTDKPPRDHNPNSTRGWPTRVLRYLVGAILAVVLIVVAITLIGFSTISSAAFWLVASASVVGLVVAALLYFKAGAIESSGGYDSFARSDRWYEVATALGYFFGAIGTMAIVLQLGITQRFAERETGESLTQVITAPYRVTVEYAHGAWKVHEEITLDSTARANLQRVYSSMQAADPTGLNLGPG